MRLQSFTCDHSVSSPTYTEVLIIVPLRALLDQFAPDFLGFCKVGTGHNKRIDFESKGFIAVTDSVHLLEKVKFDSVFMDEAHHPLPAKLPKSRELYRFSATYGEDVNVDFQYPMGKAIEDGVLCDYDITVPVLTAHHAYVCLADLLLKQAGKFRRVLAYCNSVAAAKRFRMVLKEVGLGAWHINGNTPLKRRNAVIEEFAGALQKPVHILVTVEVLGEGINIPNADTCMFVEPRRSYRSIVQAIGRVLRHHPEKTLAHVILPAVLVPDTAELISEAVPGAGVETRASKPDKEPSLAGPHLLDGRIVRDEHNTTTARKSFFDRSREKSYDGHSPSQTRAFGATPRGSDVGPQDANQQDQQTNGAGRKSYQGCSSVNDCSEHSYKPRASRAGGGGGSRTGRQNGNTGVHQEPFRDTVHTNIKKEPPKARKAWVLQGSSHERSATSPKAASSAQSISGDSANLEVKGSFQHRGSSFDQQYSSQLERFLATLVRADYRLFGADVSHRIQFIDCGLGREGELGYDAIIAEVRGRLSLILMRIDPWEIRFKHLEEFVEHNERLPSRRAKDPFEISLATWLNNHNSRKQEGALHQQRLQRLLNASSPLIRDRSLGWLKGGRKFMFLEKCQKLKEHLDQHQALPKWQCVEKQLAKFLNNLRQNANQEQLLHLQGLHPLLDNLVQSWQAAPSIRIAKTKWAANFRSLSEFVCRQQRLPRHSENLGERKQYRWLHLQLSRLSHRKLPHKFEGQLLDGHPLIAQAASKAVARAPQLANHLDVAAWLAAHFLTVPGLLPTAKASANTGVNPRRDSMNQHARNANSARKISSWPFSHCNTCSISCSNQKGFPHVESRNLRTLGAGNSHGQTLWRTLSWSRSWMAPLGMTHGVWASRCAKASKWQTWCLTLKWRKVKAWKWGDSCWKWKYKWFVVLVRDVLRRLCLCPTLARSWFPSIGFCLIP